MSEFWDANAGVTATSEDKARANRANTEARALMDASSLSGDEVAATLRLSLATVLEHATARTLYSYPIDGRLVFPDWQFNEAGSGTIPSLATVLHTLPSDLHPQSVAGFFLTPQPDLVLNGSPVSVKAWLETGGSTDPVLALAEGLAADY